MHGTIAPGKSGGVLSRQPGGRGARSRERLLESTLGLAAERGYDGTSIAQISKRSGLPASSIYWYFDNKDQLLAAALEHGMTSWVEQMVEVSQEPVTDLADTAHDRFRRAAEAAAQAPPFWQFGLMLSLEDRIEEPDARRRFRDAHHGALDFLAAWWSAELPPALADPSYGRRLAELQVAVIDALYVANARGGGWDLERLATIVSRGIVAQIDRWERDARTG
jgi:AcrR family transcriptional regulator